MGIGDRRTERPPTQEVAAAASCGATDPTSLVDGHLPPVEGIVLQGIWCEVTDLYFVKMGLEVLECHPEMGGGYHQNIIAMAPAVCTVNPLPGEGRHRGLSPKEGDREKERGKREGDEEAKG